MVVIRYGYTDWTIDVSDIIKQICTSGICPLIGINYNAIFTDPIMNVEKILMVSDERLSSSIHIRENTNIIIDINDSPVRSLIVYIGDEKNNHFVTDMEMIGERRYIHYREASDFDIKSVASDYPDFLIIVIPRYDEESSFECDYVLSHLDHLIRVAELFPSVSVMCNHRYNEGTLSSLCFCARGTSILNHFHNGKWNISHYHYMEWSNDNIFNISNNSGTRVRKPVSKVEKFLKIDPILCRYGLLNQLNNICNALVLGHMTNRDILEPRFNVHYNLPISVPLSHIVDIYHLNHLLKKKNIYTRIVPSIPVIDPPAISDIESMPVWYSLMQDMIDRVPLEPPVVNVGCSMPNTLRTSDAIDILANMKFSSILMEAARYSSGSIEGQYCCLHLRLEDDWLCLMHAGADFNNMTQLLLNGYKLALQSVPEDMPIYICTGLGKSPNMNDHILDDLKKLYPRAISARPWRTIYDLPEGREIDALVDYITGVYATMFIGDVKSTFSLAIANILKAQGKQYILI